MAIVYRFLCVLVLAFVLGGCSTATAPIMDNRSLETLADDAAIKTELAALLVKESPTKAYSVNVHSFRGHVFLIGEADKNFRAFAEKAANNTKSVRKVTTHWFASGISRAVNDTKLEAAIDSKLLFSRNVRSTQVIVDVWGGNVVLTGIMGSQADINRALEAVRSVSGVKSVTSYLEVI